MHNTCVVNVPDARQHFRDQLRVGRPKDLPALKALQESVSAQLHHDDEKIVVHVSVDDAYAMNRIAHCLLDLNLVLKRFQVLLAFDVHKLCSVCVVSEFGTGTRGQLCDTNFAKSSLT
jgi:hypothetical protein